MTAVPWVVGLLFLSPWLALAHALWRWQRRQPDAGGAAFLIVGGAILAGAAVSWSTGLVERGWFTAAATESSEVARLSAAQRPFPFTELIALRGSCDELGALMLATLGLSLVIISRPIGRVATAGIRVGLLLLAGLAVGWWWSDGLGLALVLQVALLTVASLLMAWSSPRPESGDAARGLWMLVAVPETAWLLATFGWAWEAQATQFSILVQPETVAVVAARSLAVAGSLGALIWLGALGRLSQFPAGWSCDAVRWQPGVVGAAVFGIALLPVGFRWVWMARPWWLASPEVAQSVLNAAALSGCLGAAFGWQSRDPRVRVAWLGAWQASLVVIALLRAGDDQLALVGWAMASGLLAVLALLAVWETAAEEAPQAKLDDAARFAATGHWTERFLQGGGHGSSLGGATWTWRGNWGSRAAVEADSAMVVARGGRSAVLWAGTILLLPPLVLTVVLSDGSEDGARWTAWPRLLQLASVGLAAAALGGLIKSTRSADGPVSLSERLTGGLLLLPAALLALPSLQETWQVRDVGLFIAVALCVLLGVVFGWRTRTDASRRSGLLTRLVQRRLYLPQLLTLALSWPVRGLAQVCRFLDGVVWGRWIAGAWQRVPQWGVDAEIDLHRTDAGFYALSLGLCTAVLAGMLMWLSQ